jgi:hypothetical protein
MSRMIWRGAEIDPYAAHQYALIKRKDGTSPVNPIYTQAYEYTSIVGMMAFAVWVGLPLVLLTPDEPSDYGEDFLIDDWKVDIKATAFESGGLAYRQSISRYVSDVYVLAVVPVDPMKTRLAGWAWHEEMRLAPKVDWNNRGKPARVLGQRRLHPMAEMRGELRFQRAIAC